MITRAAPKRAKMNVEQEQNASLDENLGQDENVMPVAQMAKRRKGKPGKSMQLSEQNASLEEIVGQELNAGLEENVRQEQNAGLEENADLEEDLGQEQNAGSDENLGQEENVLPVRQMAKRRLGRPGKAKQQKAPISDSPAVSAQSVRQSLSPMPLSTVPERGAPISDANARSTSAQSAQQESSFVLPSTCSQQQPFPDPPIDFLSLFSALVPPPPPPPRSIASDDSLAKKREKRQQNRYNRTLPQTSVRVEKGKVPAKVKPRRPQPDEKDDEYFVKNVLASTEMTVKGVNRHCYLINWKDYRGQESFIFSESNDALEFTVDYAEDVAIDATLLALADEEVDQLFAQFLHREGLTQDDITY